jgi:hypothetical protein
MALLEELKPGVLLKGLVPGNLVTVIDVKRQGSICVELTYKDASGHFDSVLLYRESEPHIEIASEAYHGASMQMALPFASLPRLTASTWLTSSTH